MAWLVKYSYFLLALLIGLAIAWRSMEYFNPDFQDGFLLNKKEVFSYYRFGLYAHIVSAPIAFILGLWQLLFINSSWHRLVGKIYIITILGLAAPSGLFMSFFAIGGLLGTLNFSLLSISWFIYTYLALTSIKKGLIEKHIRFIIASFILTNSAILLRLFSFVNNQLEFIPGVKGYLIVSLLSWLPGILFYEFFWKKRSVPQMMKKMSKRVSKLDH